MYNIHIYIYKYIHTYYRHHDIESLPKEIIFPFHPGLTKIFQVELGMEKLFEHKSSAPWSAQSDCTVAIGPKARFDTNESPGFGQIYYPRVMSKWLWKITEFNGENPLFQW